MSTFDEIAAELIAERGGAEALTVTQLAVARRLAKALVDDDGATASTIAALVALLPAPPSTPPAAPCDLSRLSDAQLAQLAELMAVASGETPAPPPPEEVAAVAERSPRYWLAVDLAATLDAVAAQRRPLTEVERTQVAGAIGSLLFPICLPRTLWAEAAPVRAGEVAAAEVPAAETPPGAAPEPNVVPLRVEPKDAADCQPLYAPQSQPWRDQLQGTGAARFDHPGGSW